MKAKKAKVRNSDDLRAGYTRADFPAGFVRGKYAGRLNPGAYNSWLVEAERRSREIDTGKVTCVPAEEVFKKIDALLKKR